MSFLLNLLPAAAQSYVRLARLDKPAGFMLLLFPAWWAQILATPDGEMPSIGLLILFFIGAVVMRGAGCAVNDVFDHKLDEQVERTRTRPIASGEIKPWQGIVFACACCVVGLFIVLQMGGLAFWLSVLSLPLIALYPLMKRITWWPQVFLGIIFNWGAMMGFAAVTGALPMQSFILYAACFFWTLAYDTIYAFQDKRDDEVAGIKSTAIVLGSDARRTIFIWAGISFVLLLVAGAAAHLSPLFYAGMVVALGYMAWILKNWRMEDRASSLAAFQANSTFGWIVFAAMLVGRIIV